jgi:hypothetical protein
MAGASVVATGRWDGGNLRRGAQQDLGFVEKQAKGFGSSITGSFGGIGAAIGGAFAATAVIDFFKQSAQAAMEDQKSMIALATAMENVGLAAKNAEAEGLINSMSMQYGIADDKLRPAFQKLATATRDVGKAQGLLQTAMDLSAAGYGDLEGASKALSAAAMGNFTALQRLKVPIDANIIKAKDFEGAMKALNSVVGGQATAAAASYQGQMDRLTVAVGEAQEAIGYALLGAVDNLIGKMGGTDGLQGMILETGNEIASMINDVSDLADGIDELARGMITLSTLGLVQVGEGFSFVGGMLSSLIGTAKQWIMGPLPVLLDGLKALGLISEDTTDAQKAQTSATVQAALASGKAAPVINDLTEEVQKSGLAAYTSAQSFAAFWTAAANLSKQQAITRELLNTSGTVGAALFAQALNDTGKAAEDTSRKLDGLKTSTGGAGKAADDLAVKWKAAAASIGADVEILKVTMGGGGDVIASGMVSAFQNRLDAFKSIVSTQTGIIKQAREALDSYAQSVTDTILGKINFSTSTTDAEGKSVPLTPEQIVTMILGDIANQQNAVTAIAGIATQLPPALTQQIMALPPDAAIALANYLAANPAMIEKLNLAYTALAELTKTTLGVPMAAAFAEVGGTSATSMITSAKSKIAAAASSFQSWVQSKLDTTVTVTVKYVYDVGTPPAVGGGGIPGRAVGGPVSAGSPYVVGERGPELFIPDVSGTIIPNGSMSGAGVDGGNSYSITVNAGVGDPRAIGKSVVEAITLFERSSGPVFARA